MARRARMPFLAKAAIGCLVLAIASLALPSGPTYDAYAWLIWGRDLAHLHLDTTGSGTAWKPLPSIVDAFLAPLGARGAADAWLVIGRAGALFAIVMAARLAWRLAPRGTGRVAAAIAAVTLVLTHEYVKRNGVGDAEGLMLAFGLLAIDRHLDGRRGQALGWLLAASLIRVEPWPFTGVYAAWFVWRSHWSAAVTARVAAAGVAVLALWFGGDWIGSGQFTTAAGQARQPVPGAPGYGPHPFRTTLVEAFHMLPPAAWVAVAVALGSVAMAARNRRGSDGRPAVADRAVVLMSGAAGVWILIVAGMAALRYAGLPRFMFMADGLLAVVAGIGVARAITGVRLRFAFAAAPAAVVLAFACGSIPNALLLPGDVHHVKQIADMDSNLARAVAQAGGADAIFRCGQPSTTWYAVTALAYDLRVAPQRVPDQPTGPRPIVFHPYHPASNAQVRACSSNS